MQNANVLFNKIPDTSGRWAKKNRTHHSKWVCYFGWVLIDINIIRSRAIPGNVFFLLLLLFFIALVHFFPHLQSLLYRNSFCFFGVIRSFQCWRLELWWAFTLTLNGIDCVAFFHKPTPKPSSQSGNLLVQFKKPFYPFKSLQKHKTNQISFISR